MKRIQHKKHKTKLKILAFMLITLLVTGTVTISAAAADYTPEKVKVGYYENEVFEEGARDGAVKSGYAYEYYRKISEYTGWDYEYVYGTFSDLYQKLLDGEIDLLAGLAYKEDRAGLIGYPDLKMGNETFNLVKHDTDADITTNPSSLNGRTFGVLNSAMEGSLNSYLDLHNISAQVVTYDDYDTLFAAFDAHEIDILAAEGDGAYNRDHAEVIGPFGESDYYLCVSITRPDLLEELNTAQALLETDEPNYLSSLNAKYYPVSLSSRAFSPVEKEWLQTHDALCVGYLDDYLPYSDKDANGEVTGLVKDYLPELFSGIGASDISIIYIGYQNYDDMIQGMRTGQIDVAFPVGGGPYYSEVNDIYQSTPVLSFTTEQVYLGDYNDETEKRIAVNENNRIQYYYAVANFPGSQFVFYPSTDACLEAVLSGEVGSTTLNGIRASDILRNRKYEKLSSRRLNNSDDHCFGVEIGNKGLLKLINRGISVVGTDAAEELAYRYTNELYTVTFIDFLANNFFLFGVLIILIAAMIIFFLVHDSNHKKKQIAMQKQAQWELEGKNIELAHSKEALSDALIAAENANRAKTTFLNNMSHDIRTPMNAIVGFTAMAAANIDNKELVQDYLSKITVSSRHLLSLINDVLDMSRIESGKMKIEESDVHLPDLIHDLRTIVQTTIKAKQQEFYIDTQDVRNEDIVTDKLRLSQVLLNILTNAVKFTPAGGLISFRVIETPSPVDYMTNFEFRIKDNGIGMSEEFQKSVFEAFSREEISTAGDVQGTGLGMAITKNIVDLMGGTITFTSAVGKGSEFVVCLPCKISSRSVKYEQLPELQGLRALVADDDTNACLSTCSMLRDIGMRPDWTNYGKEAVVRAKEAYDHGDRFNAYIIDWMLPDLNGIETVRRIRKVIGPHDPIIILTAYDWAEIEKEAREAGVTGFCSKPLFMSELRDVLSKPFHVTSVKKKKEVSAPDFSGMRALLAEDNELNQMIAVSILEGVGFAVEIAQNGEEALNMVKKAPAKYYDVILMDIQMPIMDGYESSRRIRKLSDLEKASVPIIALTANAFEEDRRTSLEAGLNGHLTKPYDIPIMMETLEKLLK